LKFRSGGPTVTDSVTGNGFRYLAYRTKKVTQSLQMGFECTAIKTRSGVPDSASPNIYMVAILSFCSRSGLAGQPANPDLDLGPDLLFLLFQMNPDFLFIPTSTCNISAEGTLSRTWLGHVCRQTWWLLPDEGSHSDEDDDDDDDDVRLPPLLSSSRRDEVGGGGGGGG